MKKKLKEKSVSKTDMDKEALLKEAQSIVNKPNIKKYDFSVEKVLPVLKYLHRKSNGKFKIKDAYKFAAGYCDTNDTDYNEVNAIITLMKRHHPKEMVLSTIAKGKKILIIGDVAKELLTKSIVKWDEIHISTAVVKIPIVLPLKRKLKSFGGETIMSEIEKNKKTKKKG